jgi:hypothetical protein
MGEHESLHTAPSSHSKLQPPPEQLFMQCEPGLQSKTQRPPEHEAVQVAPGSQTIEQPPWEQLGEHVAPASEVQAHPAPGTPPSPHAGGSRTSEGASADASGRMHAARTPGLSSTASHSASTASDTAC